MGEHIQADEHPVATDWKDVPSIVLGMLSLDSPVEATCSFGKKSMVVCFGTNQQ